MSAHRLAACVSAAVVAVGIAIGLYFSGSPAEQRLQRLDDRRVEDLRRLQRAIDFHYTQTGALPTELDQLVDGRALSSLPRDPESGTPYELSVTGEAQFELCAEFSRNSTLEPAGSFWSHGPGRKCFEFDYSSRQPLPTAR